MNYDGPFDFCPLWLLLVATIAIVCVAVEIGHQLGKYRRAHLPEQDAPVGAMVAAMLGLLAFVLAFTFGLAASRFDERRHTVLDEGNAIGTDYLRAALLPEPQRTEIRRMLRDYVDVRLDAVRTGDLAPAMAKSTELQNQMWSQTAILAQQDPKSIVVGLFIQSLNQVIDLHSKRVMVGLGSRIPVIIWAVLYFVAIFTMATVGYQEGLAGSRRSLAAIAVVITFSAIMFLILDLDRPAEGLLRVNQQTLIDLQTSMKAEAL